MHIRRVLKKEAEAFSDNWYDLWGMVYLGEVADYLYFDAVRDMPGMPGTVYRRNSTNNRYEKLPSAIRAAIKVHSFLGE